jgi:conjugal transfer mating pair stabilization protein TraG
MWEFRSYGSGGLYHDIFNAVALMSGANAMDSLIRLALVLGVVMGIVKAVTDFNVGTILRWYIFAVVIYGVLWVPKVSIQVEDRLNPAVVHPIVANVPLGVGASSALISQIGDRIIKLTETAFADPVDGEFSKHGMIFGAKMFAKINTLRPSDQRTALNLRGYMQDCAFYDIADNTVQIDALSKSADMWQTLTATPNPARMGPYTNADGSTTLKNCADFATQVGVDLGTDLPNIQKYLVASVDPDVAEANMNAEQANVSNVVTTAIGSSQSAVTIIKQAVVRNMLNDSLKGYMGSSSGVLGATMAELQTQNTQKLLGVIGEKAVVNLKIVIELLFIGIFPVIFPLFLLPKLGPAMAKGYLAGFFYLQLWGPMYVILHKVMMANAFAHTAAATFGAGDTHVFNALTLDASAQANQDVCTLAGSMMLMIPVLAGLLTKGAMAVGAQGEALLGNFRSGAESASSSLTSGNWSLGNAAVGNHSWDNENANQHVTSRYEDRARSTVVGADGVTMTRYGNGLNIANAALSSGALDLARQRGYSESLAKSSQSYLDQSQALTDSVSVGKTRSKAVTDEVFRGWSNNTVNMSGMSSEEQASSGRLISDLQQLSQYYQTSRHMSKGEADAEATRAAASVYSSLEASAGVKGDIGVAEVRADAKAGVRGEASKEASTTATQSKSNDRGYSLMNTLSTDITDTHNRVSTDAARSAFDRSHTTDNGARHVDSSTFSSLQSITDTATKLHATGTRLSEDATNVRNGSETVTGNQGTAFFNWMLQDKGMTVSDARSLWVGATPQDLQKGMALAEEFNGLQADSLAKKYESAATPANNHLAQDPVLISAAEATRTVSNDAGLRPGAGAADTPSKKSRPSRKSGGASDSGAPDQPHGSNSGWSAGSVPSLAESPQAAAFAARDVDAQKTTKQITADVQQGQQDLGGQQVREHIDITKQTGDTLGKVGTAGKGGLDTALQFISGGKKN